MAKFANCKKFFDQHTEQELQPIMKEYQKYKNQVGLNLVRNKDMADEVSKRSQQYMLKYSDRQTGIRDFDWQK